MAKKIDTERKIIYNLLGKLFPFKTILVPTFSKTVKHTDYCISVNNLDQNDYFTTIQFSQFGKLTDLDLFNEFVIRILTNKQAEVLSIRQAHFDIYEETYFKRNGVEHARQEIRHQAHQFLFEWLTELEKNNFQLN